ncbi:cysteate synthase [Saccharicrinis sp. FJH62]|uniref:cysteate synthase n=1 Tax=Saccharicrinis sp. FJH62 TaxID=3344657 RepID=UPI0035D4299E
MMNFAPTKYSLVSVSSAVEFEDEGWTLDYSNDETPSLIRADYENKQLTVREDLPGLYRFADWLPIKTVLEGSGSPVTYKSTGLAKELGLENLYITFNGYWPEKGAEMRTGSFKECEAYSVCARLHGIRDKVLVVASAGNTARAFASVCSRNKIPLLLCVPEDNLDALWFDHPIDPCVKLVASQKGADYFDAIHLSNIVCKHSHFLPEGGAKNIARRDGMGTTVLSAVTTIGEIPHYYFQAVGSGTGAIAAWEANLRFLEDGNYGNRLMKLMVSQNHPFVPIADAYVADSRDLFPFDDDEARRQVEIINAKVLSNRKPPYSLTGGLYDALKATDGEVLVADNEEAEAAVQLFKKFEGADIEPAAAIALATLINEVKSGKIEKDKIIMLNITGGGGVRFRKEHKIYNLKPEIIFPIDPDPDLVIKKVLGLFKPDETLVG